MITPTLLLLPVLFLTLLPVHSLPNVTVLGTVFCDACSEHTFSNHSYFLQGVKVRIVCMFDTKMTPGEEISINKECITDKFGMYKIEIPLVDGFECRVGRELESFCRASLVQSPSPLCNIPSLSTSSEHLAVKSGEFNSCVYDLNALSFKPPQRDASLCGIKRQEEVSLVTVGPSNLNSTLFFWPPFFPWPHWFPSPFPFPFPFPLPFPCPNSPSLPFPFPSPPSLPFPLPQIPFLTPPPPAFPIPLPPLPFLVPPTPPPSFPFPFPFPPFSPFNPIPKLFPPLQPTLSPPPPAFPFPFPPFSPIFPFPHPPSPPTPTFTLSDPRKQNQLP